MILIIGMSLDPLNDSDASKLRKLLADTEKYVIDNIPKTNYEYKPIHK